jgi:hypothetical protein
MTFTDENIFSPERDKLDDCLDLSLGDFPEHRESWHGVTIHRKIYATYLSNYSWNVEGTVVVEGKVPEFSISV